VTGYTPPLTPLGTDIRTVETASEVAGVSGTEAGVAVADQPAGTVAPRTTGPLPVECSSTTALTSPLVPAVTGAVLAAVTASCVNGVCGGVTVKV